ncbi:hypothetical protein NIES2098_38030 [Calothrix sp. NIES-2098]|nr:hypothetical protein NIES2098_38030 [Calothrix sp. NIES-2098]
MYLYLTDAQLAWLLTTMTKPTCVGLMSLAYVGGLCSINRTIQ